MILGIKNLRVKKILGWIWLSIVLSLILLISFNPSIFNPTQLKLILEPYRDHLFLFYVGFMIFRCLFLIPPTLFLFLGYALFPDAVFWVTAICFFSVLGSGTVAYYFAQEMGWTYYFERKYPKKMHQFQEKLNQPQAVWFISFWSFLPAFPTDLICCAAGLVPVPYRIFIFGIIIGQIPLLSAYALLGHNFFN